MPYPEALMSPFSFKTNRYELYALGEAMAGWKRYIRQDTDNLVLEVEKSFFRLYHLDELSRKVIARKLVDHAGSSKEFRMQLSATQIIAVWLCYKIYGPPRQDMSNLRSIMSKLDKEVVNRLNQRQLDSIRGADPAILWSQL